MGVKLTKDSIDLGIVCSDQAKMLAFYRDTLGFEHIGTNEMPGGVIMERLMCGTSAIKLLAMPKEPPAKAPPGGIGGATGYRYWTISVSNLDEVLAACEAAGYKIAVGRREIRPGVTIGLVEDPDGNIVELLESA